MDIKTIKILLVEDNPDDVFFLGTVLRKVTGTHFQLETAPNLAASIERLAAADIDLVILDLTLPDSTGLDTFNGLKSHARNVPIIILSGMDDETLAVNAVHAGAEDYLVKGRADSQLITRAIFYAMERSDARKAVIKAEEKFRSIFENSVSGIFQTTPEGRYLNVNPSLARIYGYNTQEELMARISDIGRLLYVDPSRRAEFIRLMHEQGVIKDFESQVYRKDGSVIWISENARAVRDDKGQIQYYEGTVEDFTARKEAEEKLRFSETRFRSVWQNSFDGMRLTDELGIILAVNPSFCQIVGMRPDELVGRAFTVIYSESEDLADMMQKYQRRFAERQIGSQTERQVAFRSGRTVDLELSNSFIELEEGRCLVLSIFRDVTIRKQAEERERLVNAELARSQAELRKKNEILEDDLKMAREIQQAILPQQYPAFPPGAPPESQRAPFLPSLPPHRPGRRRFLQHPQALGQPGRAVYLRRDGARRPLRARHGHGARAGGGIAARGHGPRPIIDANQLRSARHFAADRHAALHHRLLFDSRPAETRNSLCQRRPSQAVAGPPALRPGGTPQIPRRQSAARPGLVCRN